MIYSIHQPCYFPWLGLLAKFANSDGLIVMDEVQLSDSAFQHRNQFLTSDGKVKYLTIPFVKQNYLQMTLREIRIANPDWGTDHRNFLISNYKKHPFFDEVFSAIEPLFLEKFQYLVDVINQSMATSMSLLGIAPKIIMQSELTYDRQHKKEALILDLLDAVGAKHYLSGTGAKSYQHESSFTKMGIRLEYTEFSHPTYPQKNSAVFVPGLSCLDLLFNVGAEDARKLLRVEKHGVVTQ